MNTGDSMRGQWRRRARRSGTNTFSLVVQVRALHCGRRDGCRTCPVVLRTVAWRACCTPRRGSNDMRSALCAAGDSAARVPVAGSLLTSHHSGMISRHLRQPSQEPARMRFTTPPCWPGCAQASQCGATWLCALAAGLITLTAPSHGRRLNRRPPSALGRGVIDSSLSSGDDVKPPRSTPLRRHHRICEQTAEKYNSRCLDAEPQRFGAADQRHARCKRDHHHLQESTASVRNRHSAPTLRSSAGQGRSDS